jgi:hypothetical protein
MHLVPRAFQRETIRHFSEGASLATSGSASFSAAGTGLAFIPVSVWFTASAAGSLTYYNGTGGSALMTLKTQAGGVWTFDHWEEPNGILANKFPVLESNAGIGVHEFHVYCIVARTGAGQSATGQ